MISPSLFTVDDYVLFGIVICIYLFSGYYFAQARGQAQNSEDFMSASGPGSFGGKLMSMSLASSTVPGLAILNLTVQLYYNGLVVGLIFVAYVLGIIITVVVFLPLFSGLNNTSIFNFLKLRFSRFTQVIGIIVFCIYMVTFCVLNVYVSITAVSEATGFPSQTVVIIGGVTTVYTAFGGMRAVVWTQVHQYVVVCLGLMGFVLKGVIQQGADVFTSTSTLDDSSTSSPVPVWYTAVTLMVGGTIQAVSAVAVNQSYIQRVLTLKPKKRKRVFLWSLLPLSVTFALLTMSALIINATRNDCSFSYPDLPFLQILPYTVTHGLKHHPGMPGFFLAVMFSAPMSLTASTLHSIATVIGEDFIKTTFTELRDSIYLCLLKGCVIYIGLIVIVVPLIMNGNQAQQLALSIPGIFGGPLLGLFTLGICFSRIDSVAASIGFGFGVVFNIWSYMYGSKIGVTLPHIEPPLGCNDTSRPVLDQGVADNISEPQLWNYFFSYNWYAFSGFVVVVIVGTGTGLVRGCKSHINSEESRFISRIPCLCIGTKTNDEENIDANSDDNHVDVSDDDDTGGKHREFHELELYHRSPYHRGPSSNRSRWLMEGRRFYESGSFDSGRFGAVVRDDASDPRRPLVSRRTSSMTSSVDSAYATVRGFDIRREFQIYVEEPVYRSVQSLKCAEDINDRGGAGNCKTVGRFKVAEVAEKVDNTLGNHGHLNGSSPQTPDSRTDGTEPSTSRRKHGQFQVTPSLEKTLTSSSNISGNVEETKNVGKMNRFLVSKCSLPISQETHQTNISRDNYEETVISSAIKYSENSTDLLEEGHSTNGSYTCSRPTTSDTENERSLLLVDVDTLIGDERYLETEL